LIWHVSGCVNEQPSVTLARLRIQPASAPEPWKATRRRKKPACGHCGGRRLAGRLAHTADCAWRRRFEARRAQTGAA
jgi:hypothetical protein